MSRRFNSTATFCGVRLCCSMSCATVAPSAISRSWPFTLIFTLGILRARASQGDVGVDDDRADDREHDPRPRLHALRDQRLLERSRLAAQLIEHDDAE